MIEPAHTKIFNHLLWSFCHVNIGLNVCQIMPEWKRSSHEPIVLLSCCSYIMLWSDQMSASVKNQRHREREHYLNYQKLLFHDSWAHEITTLGQNNKLPIIQGESPTGTTSTTNNITTIFIFHFICLLVNRLKQKCRLKTLNMYVVMH